MKRPYLIVIALVILGIVGAGVGMAVSNATQEVVAPEQVITIPAVTIPGFEVTAPAQTITVPISTVTETVTVTSPPVTVTIPATTTGPGTTTTPPAANEITTHSFWDCTHPITSYGNHTLPLTVHVIVPNTSTFGAALDTGCVGDGDPATVDLILDVQGNAHDIGANDDALKVRGAADLTVSGHVECGLRALNAHQDGVQVQHGHNVLFEGLKTGDHATGTPTCNGSGGSFFISAVGGDAEVTNVICDHCDMVSANQGLGINSGISSGARNSYFRSIRATACRVVGGVNPVNENNTCIKG